MAGSRLEKVGTVYSRVRDLMRAGVIKESKKPVWFDVYSAFPPEREPVYVKPARRARPNAEENVAEIFYEEDRIRAKFYELYGNGPKAFDLTKTNFVSSCQRFVEKYRELEIRGDVTPKKLLDETAKALLADGVTLRRRAGGPAVAAETRDPVLSMKLTDMLAEQQADPTNATHAAEEHTHAAEEHTHAAEEHTHAAEEHTHAAEENTHAAEEHTHAAEEHTHAAEEHTHAAEENTHAAEENTHAPSNTL